MLFELRLNSIKSILIDANNENVASARLTLYLARYDVDEQDAYDLWNWCYRGELSTANAVNLRDRLVEKDFPVITVDNCKH